MYTPEKKMDYVEIATDLAEWVERNWGFFVNKNSDKIKIIQDFSEQLERLPIEAMLYIQQAKNNIFNMGNSRPPLPIEIIKELKAISFKNKKKIKIKTNFDEVKFIVGHLYKLKTDDNQIKYLKLLALKGKLNQFLEQRSIATLVIEGIFNKNGFTDEKIKQLIKNRD